MLKLAAARHACHITCRSARGARGGTVRTYMHGGYRGRRSPFPPIFSHVFPLRVYSCVYMYRPIMYRPTCIVRRYMYRTTYTRGLGSHKPIVRVVGRQEDVRGRRIHVLPCVLPCGLRIHVEYGADSCFYPIHIMFLPNTQLYTS